jgi:hypothetical protein
MEWKIYLYLASIATAALSVLTFLATGIMCMQFISEGRTVGQLFWVWLGSGILTIISFTVGTGLYTIEEYQ